MSSSLQVSRRTVARGAAWSVPIVAIGVAAPAFAASATPSPAAGASCKCPGAGGNNFNFKTVIAFTTPGADDWTFHINSYTFDGEAVLTLPPDSTLTGGDGNLILVVNKTNSAAKHVVTVTYEATNLTTNQTFQGSFGPIELTYAPNCSTPITCP